MKLYKVSKTDEKATRANANILQEGMWKKATPLNDFTAPWSDGIPQSTTFKALFGNGYLYLRYDVVDGNFHMYQGSGDKIDVAKSDRVEIFFRKDALMDSYFCLEIDPFGRVLDYSASYYRQFDYGWSWPEGHLKVNTQRSLKGYQVAVAISLKSLHGLGLLKKNRIQAGIYRADCQALPRNNADDDSPIFEWITWVAPQTTVPDFHVPSSFGVLDLEN